MRIVALAVALAGLVAAPPADACSGFYYRSALRPGTVVFSTDASAAWILGEDGAWVRLAADGGTLALPVISDLSRIDADTGVAVVVATGSFRASCEHDWYRVDRIDTAARVRTTTPRLWSLFDPGDFAISPAGRRAVLAGDPTTWVDLEQRRIGGRLDVVALATVWLDENRIAALTEQGLVVIDLRGRTTTGPLAVSGAPGEEGLSVVHESALLPLHPEAEAQSDAPRFALVHADASTDGVTIVQIERSGEWVLLRARLGTGTPAVSRASWTGRGNLLAISASGRHVVVHDRGKVRVLDRETGSAVAEVTGRPTYVAAALSRDGGRLAVASRPAQPPRSPDEEFDSEWDRARGGEGALTVEIFTLADGRRQAWGAPGTSRLRRIGGAR